MSPSDSRRPLPRYGGKSRPKTTLSRFVAAGPPPNGRPAAELARFHVGKFRDLTNSTITRNDTSQTEVNTALGLRLVYGLKWMPEGYELRQRSSTSAYAAQLQPKVIDEKRAPAGVQTYIIALSFAGS